MKNPVTWYVLADGAKARIVTRPEASASYVVVFAEDSAGAHARSRDIVTDRPGHTQESVGSARHAVEPRHDAHRMEEARFLRSIVAHVNRESARGSFDRLVIYVAPRCLATFRAGLEPATAKKLYGEYAKDLTKVPLAELPAHFGTA
ncbi:MAG: host attachment protein [Alphaproteobacteria bacterium]|nr:host attachment protein [Alphaproteobacteria bacterium]